METAETPGRLAAVATAVNRSLLESLGFDKNDTGPRGHGMCPFNIKGLFDFPVAIEVAGAGRVGSRQRARLPLLIHLREAEAGRISNTKLGIELGQVTVGESGSCAIDEAGVVIGIDDRDRLAVPLPTTEPNMTWSMP